MFRRPQMKKILYFRTTVKVLPRSSTNETTITQFRTASKAINMNTLDFSGFLSSKTTARHVTESPVLSPTLYVPWADPAGNSDRGSQGSALPPLCLLH